MRKAGAPTTSLTKSKTWEAQVSKQYNSLGGNCLQTATVSTLEGDSNVEVQVRACARTGGRACCYSHNPGDPQNTCGT